jgi:hypothetical protein
MLKLFLFLNIIIFALAQGIQIFVIFLIFPSFSSKFFILKR